MQLLSWNLRQGHARAECRALAAALRSDVVFLQESPRPEGPEAQVDWAPVPGRRWGSGIVVADGSVRPVPIAGYEGWVAGGEWRRGAATAGIERPFERSFDRCFVFSVRTPTPNATMKRRSYAAESRAIVQAIVDAVRGEGAETIIGGDFNIALGVRGEGETPVTSRAERLALEHFRAVVLVSVWQATHPGRPLPQTIRWTRDPVTPYHCDGFLVSPALAERVVCEVLEAARLWRVSDHSPVAVWLL